MSSRLIWTITILLIAPSAYAKGVVCKDFNHQSEAQSYYDNRQKGWKRLDRDKDGEPCECLPGGSKEGEKICHRWRKKNRK